MEFIALLIALALERWSEVGNKIRSFRAVNSYLKRMQYFAEHYGFKNNYLNYAITILLAMIIIGFLHSLFQSISPRILTTAFDIFILFYCLGSGFYKGTEGERALDNSLDSIWHIANRRLFGVIFWFMLLGPMGAVMYRINEHLTDRQQWPAVHLGAQYLQEMLDWIPIRLMGLSFALMGNFYKTIRLWRDGALSSVHENRKFLSECGAAAVSFQDEDQEKAAYRLLNLSLAVWLIVFGVITVLVK
jgi:AmpE protein